MDENDRISEKIRTFIRLRPQGKLEDTSSEEFYLTGSGCDHSLSITDHDKNGSCVYYSNTLKRDYKFKFDGFFDGDVNQAEVFSLFSQLIHLDRSLDLRNCCESFGSECFKRLRGDNLCLRANRKWKNTYYDGRMDLFLERNHPKVPPRLLSPHHITPTTECSINSSKPSNLIKDALSRCPIFKFIVKCSQIFWILVLSVYRYVSQVATASLSTTSARSQSTRTRMSERL
jgi:hypothetical protein